MKYIIIIIITLLILFNLPCKNFHKSKNGIYYTSRSIKSSNILDCLRDISHSLINDLDSADANILKTSLEYTTFVELLDSNHRILAWNVDKGREIGIRIYSRNGEILSPELILNSLVHELAHTLVKNNGHGPLFQAKNAMLQKKSKKYVGKLTKIIKN